MSVRVRVRVGVRATSRAGSRVGVRTMPRKVPTARPIPWQEMPPDSIAPWGKPGHEFRVRASVRLTIGLRLDPSSRVGLGLGLGLQLEA